VAVFKRKRTAAASTASPSVRATAGTIHSTAAIYQAVANALKDAWLPGFSEIEYRQRAYPAKKAH